MTNSSVVGSLEGESRRTRISFSGSALLPFLAFAGFFLIWPVIAVTLRSLKGNNGQWTISNYQTITHGSYLHAFITSIKLALITAAIGSLLGALFAYVAVRYAGPRLTAILDSVSAVFANSGGVPLAFMFIASFGVEGIVTKVLKNLGIDIYAGHFTIFSFTGVVMVYSFFQAPLMFLVFKPAIAGLRKEWSEASSSLGASSLTYLRRVVVPILTPPFVGAFFLLFSGGFSAYATARALTVGTVPLVPIIIGTLVDGNVISDQANLGDALAVGMIIVAAIGMVGYIWAKRKAAKWQIQ
jgi:putative spermidine/putrescine transport system permease protein